MQIADSSANRTEAVPELRTYIVEDSPVIRENLVAALEEMAPVRVIGTAEDERSARLWLDESGDDCDLVIIDIFLRQGSGLGLLQSLAATQRPCKRVVLYNFATPDMRRKCLALGADSVFDKSNEIDALISYCTRLAEETHGAS
jgi:DNA-binding NarL/FixJ family response regulator